MGFDCGLRAQVFCEFLFHSEGGKMRKSMRSCTLCSSTEKRLKRHHIQMEHVFLDWRLLGQWIKHGLLSQSVRDCFLIWILKCGLLRVSCEELHIQVCRGLGYYLHNSFSVGNMFFWYCCSLPGLLLTSSGSQCNLLYHLLNIVLTHGFHSLFLLSSYTVLAHTSRL